jgi:riboflavin kinase/FMN adenylyltransferase
MLFKVKHIHGMGRGKEIGFPTMNLTVPENFHIEQGIYAAWVLINDKPYKGALHYGAIPTFNQKEATMEVHLLDVTDENMPETENAQIEIDIVERLRDIKRFLDPADLTIQIARDVERVRLILK